MKQFRLENGLTVILIDWPNPSVSVVIGVHCGSRDDDKYTRKRLGRTHFLEHVSFRASRRYPTWEAMVRRADAFASAYDAFTDKSTILFCIESDRQHVAGAIELLGESILHPLIDRANVEAERERIRQEIRQYDDEPNERVALDTDRLLFHKSDLDHPILGNETSLDRISIDSLRSHHRRHFVGRRMVVVVAGGFDVERAERSIRSIFRKLRPGTEPNLPELDFRRMSGGLHLYREATQQLHAILAWPTPGFRDPLRMPIGFIRNILTNRESSKLRLDLDSVGKGYSLRDLYWCWQDIGQFHIYFPHSSDHFYKSLAGIQQAIVSLRTRLISPEELDLTIDNMSISAKGKFGDPWNAASFAAQQVINGGSFIPLRTYLKTLRRVTRSQIRQAANELFVSKRTLLVVRGPVNGLRRARIKKLLQYS